MELTANATLPSPKLLWLPRQSILSRKTGKHPLAHLLNQPLLIPSPRVSLGAEQMGIHQWQEPVWTAREKGEG